MRDYGEKPRVEKWMDKNEIKFREGSVQNLLKASERGILPAVVEKYKIFGTGESSVVFLVNPDNNPFVVKMIDNFGVLKTEADFLQRWSRRGVKTPNVLSLHESDSETPVSFSVLEFIKAPMLKETFPDSQSRYFSGVSLEMGRTLALMHQEKGEGFGEPIENKTEGGFSSLSQEVEETVFKKRTKRLIENGVLNESDLLLARRALLILEKDIEMGTRPSLTHNDFAPDNILATIPMTVIDPNPRITHPALDLASTIIKVGINESLYSVKEVEAIIAGYREISEVSDKVLAAAIIIKSHHLLYSQQKKENPQKMKSILKMMREAERIIDYK
jgi:aminoglycoside phosphotransferase (APT) family kinase protein